MTKSATKKEVLSLARKRFVRPKELEARGLSRVQLRKLVDQGLLQKTQRGLYTAKNFAFDAHVSLAEVAARSPKAVICLLTALRFHELTTENPSVVYVMLPPGIKAPRIEHPRLDVSWSAPLALASGIEEHVICGVKVKITSPAKTVVDCFKYRSKVGINVAIEALRDAWHKRLVTTDELWKHAKINRMTNVMRPYLDSIIA
ncbi:MAG TPA: type IV toxin-antitoxin system AbiEi family antitoxin domain-containing protein [Verrucomicrobiales bacterium]|nr:type IV toxin-antitoxin system AbiEi family antitoxin domain-containing protein [Verrucomicrobiales bacterium]